MTHAAVCQGYDMFGMYLCRGGSFKVRMRVCTSMCGMQVCYGMHALRASWQWQKHFSI